MTNNFGWKTVGYSEEFNFEDIRACTEQIIENTLSDGSVNTVELLLTHNQIVQECIGAETLNFVVNSDMSHPFTETLISLFSFLPL